MLCYVVSIPYSMPTCIAFNFKTSRTMFKLGLGVFIIGMESFVFVLVKCVFAY